jgi:hypothetical protein
VALGPSLLPSASVGTSILARPTPHCDLQTAGRLPIAACLPESPPSTPSRPRAAATLGRVLPGIRLHNTRVRRCSSAAASPAALVAGCAVWVHATTAPIHRSPAGQHWAHSPQPRQRRFRSACSLARRPRRPTSPSVPPRPAPPPPPSSSTRAWTRCRPPRWRGWTWRGLPPLSCFATRAGWSRAAHAAAAPRAAPRGSAPTGPRLRPRARPGCCGWTRWSCWRRWGGWGWGRGLRVGGKIAHGPGLTCPIGPTAALGALPAITTPRLPPPPRTAWPRTSSAPCPHAPPPPPSKLNVRKALAERGLPPINIIAQKARPRAPTAEAGLTGGRARTATTRAARPAPPGWPARLPPCVCSLPARRSSPILWPGCAPLACAPQRPQVASVGLTRFEDRHRLPPGVSVSFSAYSARLLAAVCTGVGGRAGSASERRRSRLGCTRAGHIRWRGSPWNLGVWLG